MKVYECRTKRDAVLCNHENARQEKISLRLFVFLVAIDFVARCGLLPWWQGVSCITATAPDERPLLGAIHLRIDDIELAYKSSGDDIRPSKRITRRPGQQAEIIDRIAEIVKAPVGWKKL